MLRRTGFKRAEVQRAPRSPLRPIERPVVYGGSTAGPAPKDPADRSPAYRELARGRDCSLRLPSLCRNDTSTTVLAHSNSLSDGKGMGYKGSDSRGLFACYSCHSWLDQGGATAEEKDAAYAAGMERQKETLRRILVDPTERQRSRDAARWALQSLGALD